MASSTAAFDGLAQAELAVVLRSEFGGLAADDQNAAGRATQALHHAQNIHRIHAVGFERAAAWRIVDGIRLDQINRCRARRRARMRPPGS